MRNIIGLTGQSGSGKSVVADILKNYDTVIIDCDDIAHKNMLKGGISYDDIVACFGSEILLNNGEIDRKALGNIVFNNSEKLKMLNKITHGHIKNYIKNKIASTNKNIVIDAPLLFEAGLDNLCSSIWAVVCPMSIRLERVMKRDNISLEMAEARFKNQKSTEFFIENADVVFYNSDDMKNIKERVIYEADKVFS